MNASSVLAELLDAGYGLSQDGGDLVFDRMLTPELRQLVVEHKPELLALVASWTAPARQLDEAEHEAIVIAFEAFREQHGPELVEHGWDRVSVFGGLDPLHPVTLDDLPGVIALWMDGWQVVEIARDRLLFRRGHDRTAWLRDGFFLGGEALTQWEALR
jgi:hypothetical protein